MTKTPMHPLLKLALEVGPLAVFFIGNARFGSGKLGTQVGNRFENRFSAFRLDAEFIADTSQRVSHRRDDIAVRVRVLGGSGKLGL